jgi:cleavage stimulation factor subunit 3
LSYVQKRQALGEHDPKESRETIMQAFDFVLSQVGTDKDSGSIWEEYIRFIKSGEVLLLGYFNKIGRKHL